MHGSQSGPGSSLHCCLMAKEEETESLEDRPGSVIHDFHPERFVYLELIHTGKGGWKL